MPVHVERRGGKYRIVEPNGRIARARTESGLPGKPVDGGGHRSRARAEAQAEHINRARRR